MLSTSEKGPHQLMITPDAPLTYKNLRTTYGDEYVVALDRDLPAKKEVSMQNIQIV